MRTIHSLTSPTTGRWVQRDPPFASHFLTPITTGPYRGRYAIACTDRDLPIDENNQPDQFGWFPSLTGRPVHRCPTCLDVTTPEEQALS